MPRRSLTPTPAKAAAAQVAVCLDEGTTSSKSPEGHGRNRIWLRYSQYQMPVVPRAFRKLSRSGFSQRPLEFCIAHFPQQCLGIVECPDVHDLSDDAMGIRNGSFRCLPPDVFASEVR